MLNKIVDMHNHTTWSDGIHSPEEIIENAIKHGVEIIGISDHFGAKCKKSVPDSKLKKYIENLEEIKDKYKNKIEVLVGIEICMYKKWARVDNLPYDTLNMLDYVLFEYIDFFPQGSVTLKEINEYTNKITCKKGLAHTNLFELVEIYDMDYVIKTLKDNDLFWEININPGYPYFKDIIRNKNNDLVIELFKKLKESKILITVGSDIHTLCSFDIDKVILGNQMAQYNYIK